MIYIGTSGWSYKGWKTIFYPKEVKEKDFLAYYSSHFLTVELNSSFYRLPTEKTIKKWIDLTPDGFVFSCKASRYTTHIKRLKNNDDNNKKMFDLFCIFEDKIGPILFQLPPSFQYDLDRLKKFISSLPKDFIYTFEFRNKNWFCQDIYDLLSAKKIALCFSDLRGYQSPEIVTSNFIYIRLHGPEITAYTGSYSNEAIKNYAEKMKQWQNEGKSVYCYFDNDQKAYATQDAQRLIKKLC